MLYFKHPTTGEIFAYETLGQRNKFGAAELIQVTQAEVAAATSPEVAAPVVVTMRQARLALLGAGLLAQVDAAIDALPSPQKEAAHIEWEYSQEVHRDRPFVQLLGPAMGLSEQQLDDLFTAAAAL